MNTPIEQNANTAAPSGKTQATLASTVSRVNREPAVSQHVQSELDQIVAELKRGYRPRSGPDNFYLQATRQVSDRTNRKQWSSYLAGAKLMNTESNVEDYRQNLTRQLNEHQQHPPPQVLRLNLPNLLEESRISTERAGDLLREQIVEKLQVSLLRPEPQRNLSLAERVLERQEATPAKIPATDDETDMPSPLDLEVAAKLPETELLNQNSTKRLPAGLLVRVVQVLQQLLERARQYAQDQVATLNDYLSRAQAMLNEARAEKQTSVDSRAIEQSLAAIPTDQLIHYASSIPIYLDQARTLDDREVGTAIIPHLQNETLDRSYQGFFYSLTQEMQRDLLEEAGK